MAAETSSEVFAQQRRSMVDLQLRARGITDERVLQAMERVPRHEFVPPALRSKAYEDHPLPIGEGQTISQPFIVAITLQALALQPSDRVLEVGTGSGYQTALLAELTQHVYSIERQESLAQSAGLLLKSLGYGNVTVSIGDGSEGIPSQAPFDAIAVSAAAPALPAALLQQLREGGRMAIPVGQPTSQQLQLVVVHEGQPVVRSLGGCAFVPMIGSQAYLTGW